MKSKSVRKFRVELKQRFLTDNSELLHGEAEICVPDRKNRDAEKLIAMLETYKILLRQEIIARNINQAFIFTQNGDFVERVETNPFEDEECDRVELTPELVALPDIFRKAPKIKKAKGFQRESEEIAPVKIMLRDRAIPA